MLDFLKPGQISRRRVLALLLAVSVLALAAMFVPALLRAPEEDRRTQCRSNLRQLGLGLAIYSNGNAGWGPSIEPKAREIANAFGVPAGCVLVFQDDDGIWKTSGPGWIYGGGYVCTLGFPGSYCPSTEGHDEAWVQRFTCNIDGKYWYGARDWETELALDAKLPGGRAVVGSLVLRYNAENAWGATRIHDTSAKAIVSDLLFFGEPGAVRNHENVHNVLFTDGSVRSFRDWEGRIDEMCKGVRAEEIERVVDEEIFGAVFDALGSEEQP